MNGRRKRDPAKGLYGRRRMDLSRGTGGLPSSRALHYTSDMKVRLLIGVVLLALPMCAQVKLTQGTDRILVDIDGKPFTAFFIGAETTKPYLHPLRAVSGTVVTRGYPMEMVEGENRDHIHHRGLWFSHGDVNGVDFWANDPSQQGPKKGKVVVNKLTEVKSGKKNGTLSAIFDWTDATGKALLSETRTMTFYSEPSTRTIDIDILLRANEKVTFGDTKEGTFAIRLAAPLEEKQTGKMVSSEGLETEKQVWGKRSPWVDYAGEIKGEKVGITIMDHPSNPRYPTYWHSRSYGLFASNPFGVKDFTKQGDGKMELEPGQTARFRFRVVIHPGDSKSSDIAGMYKKYAAKK
jgi:hypothetical protein